MTTVLLAAIAAQGDPDSGWGLRAILVVLIMGLLVAIGYWLRGSVEAERRERHRIYCPKCDSPLSPPRAVDPGRRWK